ncbi:phosphatidate cytidylyltransferase [Pusillimonas sp.]|uniref:phosphatidate cytidylyltransferase n=1 Tax=Pusillimonas sp. TaxID=3040095 RepID=UPI0029B6FFFA|nr:phosphatidate cytidylyltransferase [Pusillimonas sp.]MDX3893110.1 phosphatidate cytidylyltransferase [Pusillimonas sp.]
MLAQRVMTAVVLLAVLLGALAVPSAWPLMLLLTLAAACALWEWLRLTVSPGAENIAVIIAAVLGVMMLFCGAGWIEAGSMSGWSAIVAHASNNWLTPLVVLAWIVGATALVVQGRTDAPAPSSGLRIFGIFAVWAAWAALVQFYLAYGAWFLVSLMALIWCADIGAYFAGKALGRRKLAPRVSPGKSWEGAIAGVLAAIAWVAVSSRWPGSFGAVLVQGWSLGGALIFAAFLAALSIIGDLFESLLKRRAGRKDSSALLPGHGGVFDRIDALLPVAPTAFMLVSLGS